MTTGGYLMLIASWTALLTLAGWCLVRLLRAEGKPKDPSEGD